MRLKGYITLTFIVLALLSKPSEATEDRRLDILGDKLLNAMEVFTALSNYPISYLSDPNIPYKEIYRKKVIMDSVQYPQETLKFMKGDCDDLSVLYSSCLESIGIRTAFVIVPDHIFIIFDTGIHEKNGELISYDTTSYIVRDNYIWLPVEITKLGSSFLSAWLEGINEYRRGSQTGELEIIDVQKGWERFPSAALPPKDISLKAFDEEKILVKLEKDILEFNNYRGNTFNLLIRDIEKKIESSPDDPLSYNKLGIIYGKKGEYDLAVKEFEKVLRLDKDNPSALNNLGNIYLIKGSISSEEEKRIDWYGIAEEKYQKALKNAPEDGKIHLNLGILQYMRGADFDKVVKIIEDGIAKCPQKNIIYQTFGIDEEMLEIKAEESVKEWQISLSDFIKLIEEAWNRRTGGERNVITISGAPKGSEEREILGRLLLYWKEDIK